MTAPASAAAPDHEVEVPYDAAEAPVRGLVDWNAPRAGATLPALPPAWRNVAAAYVAGALAYSTVLTIAMTVEAWPASPAAVAAVFWVVVWPLVPVLALLLALR